MPDKPQSAAGARRKAPAATPTKKKTKRAVKAARSLRGGKKKTGRLGDLERGRGKAKKVLSAQCSVPKKKRAGVPVPLKKKRLQGVVPEIVVTLTNAQERFCQLVALKVYSNTSCYLQAYPGATRDTAKTGASLNMTKPNIQARIEWYRAEARKNVIHSIEESILWCKGVIDTPVGFVDDESPLAQKVKRTITGTEEQGTITKVEVETPCKMSAQKHLDALLGHTKEDKDREKQGNALVDLVAWIRDGANVSGKAVAKA